MECEGERARGLDELGDATLIDHSPRCQPACDDPLRPSRFDLCYLIQHRTMLGARVHKVAGARPHEYENRNLESRYSSSKKFERRRRAAHSKIGA